jgi:hypothetical protein
MFSNFHAIDCACADVPSYFAGHLCSATSTRRLVRHLRRSQAYRHIFLPSKEISRAGLSLVRGKKTAPEFAGLTERLVEEIGRGDIEDCG